MSDLARRLGAHIDSDEFVRLYRLREHSKVKLPDGMEWQLAESDFSARDVIARSIAAFHAEEGRRKREAVALLDAELEALRGKLAARPGKSLQQSLLAKTRKRDKLLGTLEPVAAVPDSYRIFPFYFAPVIVSRNGRRDVVPMRYRILPRSGIEVPAHYNVFNARRDSLATAQTWKPLFGKQHAVFPFSHFYEWVVREGKKREIRFTPDGVDTMWAACLYEEAVHPDWGIIRSFAMLTDEPPPEVAVAGHDRCPIFLSETGIDDWLSPAGKSLGYLNDLLDRRQSVHFSHVLVS